jgi:SNF2 family DNA or RNA helicase
MTTIANKYTDPQIAAEFPQDHWEDIYIEMSREDRKLYDIVKTTIIRDVESGELRGISPFQATLPLQLVCNNPALLNKSQSKIAVELSKLHSFTDKNSTKLEALKDLLDQVEGKVVIFSMFNDYGSRMLIPYLTKWGESFVLYDGSETQMQKAQDLFKENPYIKIFLSSDKGSDSINLEQATTVINYDLP